MNILFISTEFSQGPGGIGNHSYNLAKQLNAHFPVHVLTVSDYADEKQCLLFDNREKMYIYRFRRYWVSSVTYFKRIFDIIWHLKKYNYSHCILLFFLFSPLIIVLVLFPWIKSTNMLEIGQKIDRL